jgi:hypothetical protein
MDAKECMRQEQAVEKCIRQLQALGLKAQKSKLEPGSIIGGTSSTEHHGMQMFHETFFIRPDKDGGALVSVAGPGNQVTRRSVQHLEDAPEEVLSIYRLRK